MTCFDPNISLGAQSPASIAQYLSDIGDDDTAQTFRELATRGQNINVPGVYYPWKATGLRIGYIVPGGTGALVPIVSASDVEPERDTAGQRVKITLDGLYIYLLPGLGVHKVLCEFAGKNQAGTESEAVRFSLAMDVGDGASSATRGAPIFVNLEVGQAGISFEGRIIHVQSATDEWLLKALKSEAFRDGLALVNSAQPVLRPFTSLAARAVETALEHKRNKQIFCFDLGLDFSNNSTSTRMKFGSYVIVQTDDLDWTWDSVQLNREANVVVTADGKSLPFNHMVVGISPVEIATDSKVITREKTATIKPVTVVE